MPLSVFTTEFKSMLLHLGFKINKATKLNAFVCQSQNKRTSFVIRGCNPLVPLCQHQANNSSPANLEPRTASVLK